MLDHWFSHLFDEDARDLSIVDSADLGGDHQDLESDMTARALMTAAAKACGRSMP